MATVVRDPATGAILRDAAMQALRNDISASPTCGCCAKCAGCTDPFPRVIMTLTGYGAPFTAFNGTWTLLYDPTESAIAGDGKCWFIDVTRSYAVLLYPPQGDGSVPIFAFGPPSNSVGLIGSSVSIPAASLAAFCDSSLTFFVPSSGAPAGDSYFTVDR